MQVKNKLLPDVPQEAGGVSMSEWFDNMNGSKPEDILQFDKRETNGHDFCSAIINNLVVTDKSK